ncbi:TonB-dependent receptor [Hymenobacter sp.]|jgi:TonB-dependent receptor|uniref:TonB-dependent receptor n=1 Tax=Hymenobacter sp. TaxID=1898978 RepID=UPI002EDB8144
MRHLFLLFLGLLFSTLTMAQQGSIVGKVTDKKTGDGVIGATVIVTGTVQAAPVDVEGNYELKLDPGSYNITITYIGYKPLTFTGITVAAGNKTTLNGVMEESATSLKDVVVTGQKQTGTEVALIQDLKKSEVVVSGMSSDQIVKTLDRDAAEVVKRIPGVTVQNNNFIVIRGLAERYNTVLLNDALTPSAETDTRSFSFDILPSSAIDRILIFKSGSPELPGEFGGGVVKVYTKNSVLENTTSLTVSGWARSTNTFKSGYLQSNHSSTDFLGFDNGQRELPGVLAGLSGQGSTTNADQLQEAQGKLRNEFLPRSSMSRPDLRISLGVNRKFEVGSVYVSNVTSLSYANTQEQNTSIRQRFTAYNPQMPDQIPGKFFNYVDNRNLSAVRLGIIHNYQARINDRNRVEFRNFFNQYGTDEVVNRKGENFDDGERNDYSLHYQSRTIYSGQLGGNHEVGPANRTTLTWAGGYNYVFRDEPDYRQNQQTRLLVAGKPGDLNPAPFQVAINNVPTTSARYYATLKENTYMASGQVERRFHGRDTLSVNQYKLRLGFYAEDKERNYDSRYFNYARGSSRTFDQSIAEQPLETIFSADNLNATTGFVLREGTQPQDRYTGKNRLAAAYLSGVAPLSEQFNLTGGVRVEYNRKTLRSGISQGEDTYKEERTFVLPSLNATYNINERHLLRAGVSESVNRPEFREVADYQYYDFSNNFFVIGSNSLRTARIYNADLRYEFYPTRSEMLSFGLFGKRFIDAIEQVTRSTTGSELTLTYQNADKAYDVGVEVEARKSLLDMTENAFLQRISFVVNASFIRSRVDLDTTLADNKNFALTNRPLQGQSPYVVNLGTFYQDDENHWQISVQYNVIGPRIAFVGDQNQNYSVIELPRHIVDLAVTKGLGSHLEVRAGIQNIFNQEVRQYYDFDRNGKINGIEDGAAFARYKRGTYSTLGLTYRL